MTVTIAIVDVDAQVPLADRQRAAAALQRQSIEHFAHVWHCEQALMRAATPDAPAKPGEWVAELHASLDKDAGALAIHDVSPSGTPVMRVDVGACRRFGASWTSALSHEICEARADAWVAFSAQAPDGTIYALEICDACQESDYLIDGVAVSNFCTPAWFAPPKAPGAKFDHSGICIAPFQVLPGGYAQTWDPRRGWRQRGQMQGYRAYLADLGVGRGSERPRVRRGLVAWLTSLPALLVDAFRRHFA